MTFYVNEYYYNYLNFICNRAELQVAATQDYCTDSWFWTLLTGALNHQTAHHLFPGIIIIIRKKIANFLPLSKINTVQC